MNPVYFSRAFQKIIQINADADAAKAASAACEKDAGEYGLYIGAYRSKMRLFRRIDSLEIVI
ncbi:hypothetical protein AMS62_14880 [Bacillus sp. FJAT-18019]|nr:hypothetical protein AMS62_14880 [Bacillus sp. FJAT-18019]